MIAGNVAQPASEDPEDRWDLRRGSCQDLLLLSEGAPADSPRHHHRHSIDSLVEARTHRATGRRGKAQAGSRTA
jgi:hypothetical protein